MLVPVIAILELSILLISSKFGLDPQDGPSSNEFQSDTELSSH